MKRKLTYGRRAQLGDDLTPVDVSNLLPATLTIDDYSQVLDHYADSNTPTLTTPTAQNIATAAVTATPISNVYRSGGVETITATATPFPWKWILLGGAAIVGIVLLSKKRKSHTSRRSHAFA